MRIEVVNIVPPKTEAGPSGKSYQTLEVAYKDGQGKVSGKKLVDFNFPEVFSTLAKAQRGDVFEVKPVKNGKFWNWEGIAKSDGSTPEPTKSYAAGASAPTGTGGRVVGSNYPTQSERDWQQTRIGRQACLNSAIAMLTTSKKEISLKEVTSAAEALEKWVNRVEVEKTASAPAEGIMKMKDDIPY